MSPSFITLHLLLSEIVNVLPEAIYCCFTRFTTMFTVIFVVGSLKSMFIQSFVLIGCCVRAIYVPIVIYGLRLFIIVLQELHCLPNYLHVCMIRVRGCYHIIKFYCSIPYGF